ncbi:MAG: hypothetical protein ACRCU5_15025 [Rhizobiaceae bacterium]
MGSQIAGCNWNVEGGQSHEGCGTMAGNSAPTSTTLFLPKPTNAMREVATYI